MADYQEVTPRHADCLRRSLTAIFACLCKVNEYIEQTVKTRLVRCLRAPQVQCAGRFGDVATPFARAENCLRLSHVGGRRGFLERVW